MKDPDNTLSRDLSAIEKFYKENPEMDTIPETDIEEVMREAVRSNFDWYYGEVTVTLCEMNNFVRTLLTSRDTYWKGEVEKAFKQGQEDGAVNRGERRRIIEQIREERDTYWKERVRNAFNKGYQAGQVHEDPGEAYGHYLHSELDQNIN